MERSFGVVWCVAWWAQSQALKRSIPVCWIVLSILLLKFCWVHLAWWDHMKLDWGSCCARHFFHNFPSLGFEFLVPMPMPRPSDVFEGNGCKKQHLMGHSVQNLGLEKAMELEVEHGRKWQVGNWCNVLKTHQSSIWSFRMWICISCNFFFLLNKTEPLWQQKQSVFAGFPSFPPNSTEATLLGWMRAETWPGTWHETQACYGLQSGVGMRWKQMFATLPEILFISA